MPAVEARRSYILSKSVDDKARAKYAGCFNGFAPD